MMSSKMYRIAVVTAVLALFAMGAAASGVAAQSSATVSSEDVGIPSQGETANSSISIESATEDVSGADIVVSVNTSVAEITEVRESRSGSGVAYTTSIASGGSSATINYTEIPSGPEAPPAFEVAEIELQANTGNVDSTPIALNAEAFFVDESGSAQSFDQVIEDEGTLTVGSTQFALSNPSPKETAAIRGNVTNVNVDVENTGELSGTKTIEAEVDGNVLGTKSVTLDPGESQSVVVPIDTSSLDFGVLNYTVRSESDEVTGILKIVDEFARAKVASGDATIPNVGNTGSATVEVDAENGLNVGDVTVSVNTSVARISEVREGGDVNSGTGVLFEVKDKTNDSATVEYTNIGGTGTLDGFELAVVEFELVSEDAEAPIGIDADNFFYLTGNDDSVPYSTVNEQDGTVTGSLFTEPLVDRSSFVGPPTNTGDIDPTLYEDLSGDGDGIDVSQTVAVFGALVRGNDLGLTDKQARALDWNEDSPETEVTTEDMVSLFGEQVRSG